MTTQTDRRAADARRAAAERAGEKGGDVAYRHYRSAAPMPTQRREPATGQQLRAEQERRDDTGKLMLHTFGYFTAYGKPYPMWDDLGRYEELTTRGSGAATLARKPDLGFLINHRGVTMARTKTGTLLLREDDHGGWHDGWMNLERMDVRDLGTAIRDGDIDEMSFAFMIPEGGGQWSEDFTTYEIRAYDLERGDVSAVNYGANPYTDIAARSGEILRSLGALPAGARQEAATRLGVDDVERQVLARERIQVTARAVDRTASQHVRSLQWRTANTARRFAEVARDTGMDVADLANARLPWYEVRSAATGMKRTAPDPAVPIDDDGNEVEVTDVLIYDEIGGSFGTTADQFAADLADISTPRINLRINSPGGSVVDAIAIASSIRHKSDDGTQITAYVDGIAASAASVIAIAADEVVSMPGAQFMIHKASTTVEGNDDVTEKMTTFLRKQSRNIADQYAAKAGGTSADWYALMEAETWFTAEEAQNAGLIDRVWTSGTKERGERAVDDPRMQRRWDDLPYRYASREQAPVTQTRRALVADSTQRPLGDRTDEFSDMVKANARGELGTPVDEWIASGAIGGGAAYEPETGAIGPAGVKAGATPSRPTGRSIALIEAELSADGANLD